MGKRGPSPTPTAILSIRGSKRAKLNKSEPQPLRGKPLVPRHLDDDEDSAHVFNEVCDLLDSMQVLTIADGRVISRYAEMWCMWARVRRRLHHHGEDYVSLGKIKPDVRLLLQLSEAMRRIEAELGLTPSARSRIQMVPSPSKSDLRAQRFFGERKRG